MFWKIFSAIILGVRNFRVFEILEHLPYWYIQEKLCKIQGHFKVYKNNEKYWSSTSQSLDWVNEKVVLESDYKVVASSEAVWYGFVLFD